jgi:hypothetical protein
MPDYNLPDHIHYCEIGGQRVFLDLVGDRYFSLPPAADIAFAALRSGAVDPVKCADQVTFLQRAGVLIAAPAGRPIVRTCHPRPIRSLVERADSRVGPSLPIFLETWRLVSGARHAVRRRQLPAYLRGLRRRRPAKQDVTAPFLLDALARFRAARRFLPIAPNCLYDSLGLCRFLQKRGVAVDLVIGAKLLPFGAHCWLQDGHDVINDSLASARDFEPIFVA